MLRVLAIFVLPLLLLPTLALQANAAESPFQGKWAGETKNDKTNVVVEYKSEFKADGTMQLSTYIPNLTSGKHAGKWKATGEKTLEFTLDLPSSKPMKGVLLDKDTLEFTDSSQIKMKLTRVK